MTLPFASYAGRPTEVVTLFAPRADFAYRRLPVRYVRVDWATGGALRVPGLDSADKVSVLPEHGRTVQAEPDGTLSVRFEEPGQWVIEGPDGVRWCIFVDPPQAWPVPAGARDAAEFSIRPHPTEPQTAAFNAALQAIADAGGGTLVLPPGLYRSGTVQLRTGVTLYLHEGAVLQAADDPDEFPLEPEERIRRDLPRSLIPGSRRRLILAEGVERAAVIGRGVICGNGSEWRRRHVRPRLTTNLVRLVDCRDVRFEGVILRDSEFWCVHLLHCQDITFRWMKIVNELPPRGWDAAWNPGSASLWNNADGINPDSSQRVLIEDCFLHTGDDCVPVKNTSTWLGRLADVRDVEVRRCRLLSSVTALKIGTETLGDSMEDITFEGIDVLSCGRAFAIDLKDGAAVRRVTFRDIRVHRCNRPFDFWIIRREDHPVQTVFSRLQEVRVEDVDFRVMHVEAAGGESHLAGYDSEHRVEDVVFRHVRWAGRPLNALAAPAVLLNEHVHHVRCE